MFKLILFDLDGVLVDAANWHYEALNMALEQHGYAPIDHSDHLLKYNGLPTSKKLALTLRIAESDFESINEAKQRFTLEKVNNLCKPDPEKIALLEALQEKGYTMACCSNAKGKSVYQMLLKAGLLPFTQLYFGNEDCTNPKPYPDIYLHAMQRFPMVTKEQVLIVEDSGPGVAAAYAANVGMVIHAQYPEITINLFKEKGLL